MGVCFYCRGCGTRPQSYRWAVDMLRFVFVKVPSRYNVKNKLKGETGRVNSFKPVSV